jgi:hypothetical protein
MTATSDRDYVLSGRITDLRGEPPTITLTVHGYDKDFWSEDDFLGAASTDADGRYVIRYTKEQFKRSILEFGGPDIYIRVFDGCVAKIIFKRGTLLSAFR